MEITSKLTAQLARLSCLSLTDEEQEKIRPELQEMLNAAQMLQALPTENEVMVPLSDESHLRKDAVQPSLPAEDVLANAPAARDGYFAVPQAVEQEGSA